MKIHVPKDTGLELIPAGGYKAVVSGYRVKTSAQGNPYILWEFTLQSQGPDPTANTVGRKVFDSTTLTEESMWKTASLVNAVKAAPVSEGDYEVDELIENLKARVLNKELFIRVDTESYQGQLRTRVREFKQL